MLSVSNNFKKILTKKTQYDFIASEFVDTFAELHKLQIEKIGLQSSSGLSFNMSGKILNLIPI